MLSPPFFLAAAAGDIEPAAAGTITGLVIYVSIALGLSFICSVLEAVLLSTTASHIEVHAARGSRSAQWMRELTSQERIDRSIAAILTLNTIAHTVGAAGAGAQAAAIFGSEWIGVIGAVLTLLILVVSEIIPKTLGAVYWRPLMGFTAGGVRFLSWALFPIVWASQLLTDLIKPKNAEPTITRSEIEILARLGQEEGTLLPRETRVVRNLLRLDRVLVRDVLTPRTVLFTLRPDTTVDEVVAAAGPIRFSRIPISPDDPDKITSYVLRYEILEAAAEGRGATRVEELARLLHGVPETTSVAQALSTMINEKQHLALVVDEYGGTEGIITMEDAIESLLGTEITDETDEVADLRALARERAKELTGEDEEEKGTEKRGDGGSGSGSGG